MNQLIKNSFDTAIAENTASAVVDRLFIEIYGLQKRDIDFEWWNTCLNVLRFSNDIEIGFTHAKCTVLAIIKDAWDSLPIDIRKSHNMQFMNFAKTYTGKQTSTIEGYIQTAKLWILDGFGKGKRIEVNERSPDGKSLLNEYGKLATKIIEFNPHAVDWSRLSILNTRAKNNDMTEKLWEMLVDSFYTCDDIRLEHAGGEMVEGNPQATVYHLEGPGLFVSRNGHTKPIINELNWEEYETDPLVKEGIDLVLKTLGVKSDEDKIFEIVHNENKGYIPNERVLE